MQLYPEIKRFVQETLGCSCPEKQNTIEEAIPMVRIADPLPGRWSPGDRQQWSGECHPAVRSGQKKLVVQCFGQGR